jgi:hypothetical protein
MVAADMLVEPQPGGNFNLKERSAAVPQPKKSTRRTKNLTQRKEREKTGDFNREIRQIREQKRENLIAKSPPSGGATKKGSPAARNLTQRKWLKTQIKTARAVCSIDRLEACSTLLKAGCKVHGGDGRGWFGLG